MAETHRLIFSNGENAVSPHSIMARTKSLEALLRLLVQRHPVWGATRAKLTRLVTLVGRLSQNVAAGHDARGDKDYRVPPGWEAWACPSPAGWAPVTSALQSCEGWGLLSLGIFQETERPSEKVKNF